MICNNPDCLTITVGPSDAAGDLKINLGEAAHIKAARDGEARWDKDMLDGQRADISNGIWLCANCHTMVDKNEGLDFPRTLLEAWKQEHGEMIKTLLLSHRSPIAYLRQITKEGRTAQKIVDIADTRGALYQPPHLENQAHVIDSIDQLRKQYRGVLKGIEFDKELKSVLQQISKHLQEFMNYTSSNQSLFDTELLSMRSRVGLQLKALRDRYGCIIPPNLTTIVPH
jgi:DNA-binding protein Fis